MEIKPCHFCSSFKVKLVCSNKTVGFNGLLNERVRYRVYSVRCKSCHARGPTVGGKILESRHSEMPLPKWASDDRKLKEDAVLLWNNRYEGGTNSEKP